MEILEAYKKIVGVLIVTLLYGNGWGQTPAYPQQLLVLNLFDDSRYLMEVTKLNDFDMKFKITYQGSPNEERTFTLIPFTKPKLVENLNREYRAMTSVTADQASKATQTALETIADKVETASIVAINVNLKPAAGTLYLKKTVFVRQYSKNISLAVSQEKKNYVIEQVKKSSKQDNNKSDINVAVEEDGYVVRKLNSKENESEIYDRRWAAENALQYIAEKNVADKWQESIFQVKDSLQIVRTGKVSLDQEEQKLRTEQSDLEQKLNRARASAKVFYSSQQSQQSLIPNIQTVGGIQGYTITIQGGIPYAEVKKLNLSGLPITAKLSPEQVIARNDGIIPGLSLNHNEGKYLSNVVRQLLELKSNGDTLEKIGTDKKARFEGYRIQKLASQPIGKTPLKDLTEFDLQQIQILVNNDTVTTFKAIQDSKKLVALFQQFANLQHRIDSLQLSSEAIWADTINIKTNLQTLQGSLGNLAQKLAKQMSTITRLEFNLKQVNAKNPLQLFDVESVEFEFNNGFIETIVAWGKLQNNGELVKFVNVMPIGFSRSKDFDDLKNHLLWTEPANNGVQPQYYLQLSALIDNYIQRLGVDRKDYSPADQTISISPSSNPTTILYKETTRELFDAHVFSDFVGLDSRKPNGLIQTEIGKRINMVTSRRGLRFSTKGGIYTGHGNGNHLLWYKGFHYKNLGTFGYIYPSLTWSKIENNNRSLLLQSRDRVVNNSYFQERFASTLDVRNYEYMSVGVDFNISTCDMPSFKSTFTFDLGFRYGRTQVIDSIRALVAGNPENTHKANNFGLNTYRWYPKFTWDIKPDERYGISLSYQWNQYHIWDPHVTQVAVSDRYSDTGENKHPLGYGTVGLQAFFNPTPDTKAGKLFFRYTFNHQGSRFNTNFFQAQIGYSFYFQGRAK